MLIFSLVHFCETFPSILGNLGRSHTTRNELFMSNDGGVEWFQVLTGDYNYQFGDHGGIIVAASKYPTTEIQYAIVTIKNNDFT